MSGHTKGRLATHKAVNSKGDVAIVAPDAICADGYPAIIAECWEDIRHGSEHASAEAAANARRLVAAWNAVDGIPTEDLESKVVVGFMADLKRQRDELRVKLDWALKFGYVATPGTVSDYEYQPMTEAIIERELAKQKAPA